MQDYIIKRTTQCANYILDNKCTVRECAKYFGVSKSTIHSDLCYKLKEIDGDLFNKVHSLMEFNFSVKHIRGGDSTKNLKKKSAKGNAEN